tara:strand:- start:12398 stop:12655 length:258 start_codon:yes stop_codon:yes gene_type:complete
LLEDAGEAEGEGEVEGYVCAIGKTVAKINKRMAMLWHCYTNAINGDWWCWQDLNSHTCYTKPHSKGCNSVLTVELQHQKNKGMLG